MQTTLPSIILQYLENPVIVAVLSLIVIAVRQRWVKHRKCHPLPKRQDGQKPKDNVLEVIDTVLIALILVFGLVRPLLLQTFYIPSPSMEPTLLGPYNPAKADEYPGSIVLGGKRGGDKLIANKFVYRFRAPRHGEIVVFRPPDGAIIGNNPNLQFRVWIEKHYDALNPIERDQALARLPEVPQRRDDYIKRVIGIPGDRIHIVAGEGIYRNGALLQESYLPGGKSASAMNFPEAPPPPVDPQDTSGWYRAYMYENNIGKYVRDGEFVVPKDSVFVMGDNRSPGGSFDSRYWGVVPVNTVKARAISTFWPLTRLQLL